MNLDNEDVKVRSQLSYCPTVQSPEILTESLNKPHIREEERSVYRK
jgi:hypothetical protein